MKKLFICLLFIGLLLSNICFSADVVQISDTRDATGKFNNWVNQVVTWDTTAVVSIPDSSSVSYTALQLWMFPITDNTWVKGSFIRSVLGEYGIRWSRDGIIWSDVSVCSILKPGRPSK